jgi:hypothetical protein
MEAILEQLQKGEDLSVCAVEHDGVLVECTVSQELLWLWHGDSSVKSVVASRYQKIGERTAKREDSVRAIVKCKLCELEISPL